MESQRGHRYRTATSLRCHKRGQKKVKRMASNCWTASVAAPSTAAPRQTRQAVGFASLGGSAIVGASFRWNSAGKSLVSAGKLPVSAGMPVEDCRKRGRLRRCGIGLHLDGPGQGVTRGEGMAGRLVRASGVDRPYRRGGGESLGPFQPRPLSSSRAENFPHFKRNSNGGHCGKAVGRTNAGFVPLRNQMAGIIGGADRERISCAVKPVQRCFEAHAPQPVLHPVQPGMYGPAPAIAGQHRPDI